MKLRVLLCLFAALLLVAAAPDDQYQVIVNSSVPMTSISKADLSLLFLKRTTTYQKWGSAAKAVPVDLAADSETRAAFTKSVHQKAVASVKAYWQQQIFSGRGTPPVEVPSEAEMISTVSKTAGGIGYVAAGASLPSGVKAVRITQ